MPIATPEVYAEMLNRARDGKFAYPAINVTSSQTITAALQGFAEAESDGIIQISVGGSEYGSGSTIKNRVTGSLALAAYAYEVAKNYGITVALHTDHCAKQNIDSWVRPLLEIEAGQVAEGKLPTFQSHMWDGSAIPLDENLEIAKELLAMSVKANTILEIESVRSAAKRTASLARSTRSSTPPPRTASRPLRPWAWARRAATSRP